MNTLRKEKGHAGLFLLFVIFILLLMIVFPELKNDFKSIYGHIAPAAKTILKWGLVFTGFVILIGAVIALYAISKLFGKEGFLRKGFNIPSWIHGGKTVTLKITPKTFERNIRVKTVDGNIELTGVKGNKVSGEVDVICKDENAGELKAEYDGDGIEVSSKNGERCFVKAYRINLPQNVENISVHTTSGAVTVENFVKVGSIEAKSVSGSIDAGDIKDCGKIFVKTVSGALVMEKVKAGTLELGTVSGAAVIKDSKIESAYGKTVSGDIDCSGSTLKKTDFHSISGRIIR